MAITVESLKHNNIVEIIIKGKSFDESAYNTVFETINTHVSKGLEKFIINLEQIDTMNSSGLNVLIKSFTLIRNSGGELYIVNISSKINQVLLLTKLNTVLNIATSFKNALELLNK